MNKLEKEIENKLITMVESHGGLCLKWVCPGWSGVPDRLILLPVGRVIFAETKRPKGGRLSRLQIWWRERLQKFGFLVFVVWNEDDIAATELAVLGLLGRS